MIGDLDVNQDLTDVQLEAIARRAERIARWARGEVKRRKEKA